MQLVNTAGNSPSLGRPTPGVVKQDKSSRGSVDTTKTRSDSQRVRMSSGERPTGAAKGKQSDTEALCQPPPPPPVDVLVPRPATDGESETVGQQSSLVGPRESREAHGRRQPPAEQQHLRALCRTPLTLPMTQLPPAAGLGMRGQRRSSRVCLGEGWPGQARVPPRRLGVSRAGTAQQSLHRLRPPDPVHRWTSFC